MSEQLFERFVEDPEGNGLEAARTALHGGEASEFAEELLKALGDDSSWRRARALERLGKFDEAVELLPHLEQAIQDDRHADRRNAARSALAALAAPDSAVCENGYDLLRRLSRQSPDPDVRLLATIALGESGNARARGTLEAGLEDEEQNVAAAAAEALALLGDGRALPALMAATGSASFWVRIAAVLAVGRIGDPRGLRALGDVINQESLSAAAASAIGEIGDPAGLELLRAPLESDGAANASALGAVATIYGRNPDLPIPDWIRAAVSSAVPHLIRRALDEHDEAAARLLGIAGTEDAQGALLHALDDPDTQELGEIGLNELPAVQRRALVLHRLENASQQARTIILNLLPHLDSSDDIALVVDRLADEDPETRAAAAEVLGRSDPDIVISSLITAIERPELRIGATLALGRLGSERCPPLVQLLDDSDAEVRAAAADGLARCGSREVGSLIQRFEQEREPKVQQAIVRALGDIGGPEVVQPLTGVLRADDTSLRFSAASALGRAGANEALEPLLDALRDRMPEVRMAALNALGELGDRRAVSVLAEQLGQPDDDTRRTAVHAISRMADASTVARLAAALNDTDREVRLTAVETLRRIDGIDATRALEARAEAESDPAVRNAASRAIVDLRERLPQQQG